MSSEILTTTRVEIDRISKSYPTRSGSLEVLRDVRFSMNAGESLAVLGPSGSGKSTLLHILGGLEPPTSGSVRVDGCDPYGLSSAELALFRSRTVGFVFQDHHLLPQCSALENVLTPTLPWSGVTAEAAARAQDLLCRVGLKDRMDHRPAEMSGGERQRTALCRALINRPKLLLCDEPTGNLDRKSADLVVGLLLELFQQDAGVLIVVTHSQELARRLGRRLELVDGALNPIP